MVTVVSKKMSYVYGVRPLNVGYEEELHPSQDMEQRCHLVSSFLFSLQMKFH